MTHPTDSFLHPRPKSGQGQHTQESGDAGLSSNMEHKFSDNYKSALGSVEPIPKGELFERPEMAGKIWAFPSVGMFGHANAESHPVCAEERFLKPQIQATPIALSESSKEQDAVMVLPRIKAIADRQLEVEVVGENSCIMDTKMDTGGNRAKPKKAPPLNPEERRTHRRKRAAGKNWKLYLLCLMAVIHVAVSEGFPGAQPAADQKLKCFTCMDKGRCPKLMTIFGPNDTHLYQRDLSQTFPGCCGISPPDPKSCAVCRDQSNLTITCSEDVGRLEVEDSEGTQIEMISPACATMKCVPPTYGCAHVGSSLSAVLLLTVVGALVI